MKGDDATRYRSALQFKPRSSGPAIPPSHKAAPASAPVVLFDPGIHTLGSTATSSCLDSLPGLPDGSAPRPLQKVLADLALTSRMRPHQVEGLQVRSQSPKP